MTISPTHSASPSPAPAPAPHLLPLEPWLAKKIFCRRVRETGTIKAGLQAARITRYTFRVWQQKDYRFARAFQDALDFYAEGMEERLNSHIKKGDGIALRFKLRGLYPEKYGERWNRKADKPDTTVVDRWALIEQGVDR